MNIPDKCVTPTTDPLIRFEERKRVIIFSNANRQLCHRICVDGCAITDGPRCDHLLIDWERREYYVELKGSDVGHAISQLENSIPQLHVANVPVRAYVVSRNCNTHFNTTVQKALKKLQKQFGPSTTLRVIKDRQVINLV